MIRVTKMADYAILTMTWLAHRATSGESTAFSTRQIADSIGLPPATVSKITHAMMHAGLLSSRRGVNGGYSLARHAEQISVLDIISAVEGPVALTECLDPDADLCDMESICSTRANWQRINAVIQRALEGITLDDMATPRRGWHKRVSESLGANHAPEPKPCQPACACLAPSLTASSSTSSTSTAHIINNRVEGKSND